MSGQPIKEPGCLMAAEIAEVAAVFAHAAGVDLRPALSALGLAPISAIYTVARGSSDAAANILSYEFMAELGLPMTSLPPSIFSIGQGVDMKGALALVVSQSGASTDLVRTARGIRERGGRVLAITNQPGSLVEAEADLTLPIAAGPERAVPATKSVIGSVGVGLALLAALSPAYAPRAQAAAATFGRLTTIAHPDATILRDALIGAEHVYVIGRGAGFGAAQEIALKIKETCAIHAEAYSSSEVLHGPLQLATRPLTALLLDTGQPDLADSLDTAQTRLTQAGGRVWRIRPEDAGIAALCPAAAAAALLALIYPVVLQTALALGHDPDRPDMLSKVTQTT